MRRVRLFLGVLSLGFMLLWLGCHSNATSDQNELELPAWLSEKNSTNSGGENSVGGEGLSRNHNSGGIELVSNTVSSARLGLKLKRGDQFPLRKLVQQELTQDSMTGPQKSYSRLELMMAITVADEREGRTKLAVRYNRVRYQHEVGDEQLAFDSTSPPEPTPLGVVAYRDMVNDGFSFWIGQDNQIAEVEGLAEFIGRCLRNVPPAQKQDVILGIEASSGESGLANFVDNSIGLLPFGKATSPGDSWDRQQQISRPIPMFINNKFTLKDLTDQLAVIDIHGTITPSMTLKSGRPDAGVNIVMNGGNTIGSCTIYRDTGLPKESRIDRVMDMTVHIPEHGQFHQVKRVTTTIESFPVSSSAAVRPAQALLPSGAPPLPAPARPTRDNQVQPAAVQTPVLR